MNAGTENKLNWRDIFFRVIVYFQLILILLAFIFRTGPLNIVTTVISTAYESSTGQLGPVAVRDLVLIATIYGGWYVVSALFSYLLYSVRRKVLLRRMRDDYASTHGMKSLTANK